MFRVLRRLQAEALAREQDILTLNAVMHERERLGRELHDGAAQLVAHLLLRVDTIKELVATGRRREAEVELERLHGVADEIYEDIGESITGIRTTMAERGLIGTLQDYLDRFEERHRIPVSLRTDDAANTLTPLVLGLLALSNNAALRVLKTRRWKQIQRLNYALFALVILHAYFYGALLRLESPFTILLGVRQRRRGPCRADRGHPALATKACSLANGGRPHA